MLNKRIATGFMSIAGALAIAGGATFAFFTDTAVSAGNEFTTGTLDVSVTNSVAFEPSTPITGMQPGDENFVRFDVKNDGTLPVNLRAFATGEWTDFNND
jgi:predicted ribosomally synthesized peptide with SipW-like signal peptide